MLVAYIYKRFFARGRCKSFATQEYEAELRKRNATNRSTSHYESRCTVVRETRNLEPTFNQFDVFAKFGISTKDAESILEILASVGIASIEGRQGGNISNVGD